MGQCLALQLPQVPLWHWWGICPWACFHSTIFSIIWVLFYLGLDFFQLISLVDMIPSLCTMSMKSRPASCPSRHICKYGPLCLLHGCPGQSIRHSQTKAPLPQGPHLASSIHLSIDPSFTHTHPPSS
jgi:hypothetical protein